MFAIYKRELKSYFLSPIAYLLIGLFTLFSGVLFVLVNIRIANGDYRPVLANIMYLFLVFIPLLTMRVISEDRRNGTDVLLITSPTSITEIVLGKFLAVTSVFLMMIIITFIYPAILSSYSDINMAQIVGGYTGLILLGVAFISVGVFLSALTKNQIIAAISTFITLVFITLIEDLAGFAGGFIAKSLRWFSLFSRYEVFYKGILDVSSIIYFVSFTIIFIFLTVRVIDKRRWSQG